METEINTRFNKVLGNFKQHYNSISEIEKNILNSAKAKRLSRDRFEDVTNLKQLKIVSPFYDRNKICKALNCHCPYHKRIKQQTVKRSSWLKHKRCVKSLISSPNKHNSAEHKELRLTQIAKINQQNQNSLDKSPKQTTKSGSLKLKINTKQFDQFLKLQDVLIQKKITLKSAAHRPSKISVGQIFKYLYDHLDQGVQQIKVFLEEVEKDRDMSNFYIQRFEDLKKRRNMPKRHTKVSNFSNLQQIEPNSKQQSNQNSLRKPHRMASKFFEKKASLASIPKRARKLRPNTKRLIIQDLIQDIENGRSINMSKLKKISGMNLALFQENLLFLKKKLDTMNNDVLNDVKQQVLLKMINQLQNSTKKQVGTDQINLDSKVNFCAQQAQHLQQSGNTDHNYKTSAERLGAQHRKTRKMKSKFNSESLQKQIQVTVENEVQVKQDMINSLLTFIDQKLYENQPENNVQNQQLKDLVYELADSNNQRDKSANRKMSTLPNQKNKKSLIINFYNDESQNGVTQQQKIKQEKSQVKDSGQKIQPIFIKLDEEAAGMVQNGGRRVARLHNKLKIAKFRKLSHEIQFHPTLLNEEDCLDQMMQQMDDQHLKQQLENLKIDANSEWQRIRALQKKITSYHMKEIVIEESDSLLTIKRKARVYKQLIENQKITDSIIKKQITEYVKLIQKMQMLKHRKWAKHKLRNSSFLENHNLAEVAGSQQYNPQNALKSLIDTIFLQHSKLFFYDLQQSQTARKSICMQNYLSQFIKKDFKLQQKSTKLRDSIFQIVKQQQKIEKKQAQSRSGDLVQIDLQNRCSSCLFFDESINHRHKTQHFRKFRYTADTQNDRQTNQQPRKILSLINQFKNFLG